MAKVATCAITVFGGNSDGNNPIFLEAAKGARTRYVKCPVDVRTLRSRRMLGRTRLRRDLRWKGVWFDWSHGFGCSCKGRQSKSHHPDNLSRSARTVVDSESFETVITSFQIMHLWETQSLLILSQRERKGSYPKCVRHEKIGQRCRHFNFLSNSATL